MSSISYIYNILQNQALLLYKLANPYLTLLALLLISIKPILITVIFILAIYLLFRIFLTWKISNTSSTILELTPPTLTEKSAYTTSKLFSLLYELGRQKGILDKLLNKKNTYSLEIVSTRETGIRFLIRSSLKHTENVKRIIYSYMSSVKITQVDDYISLSNSFKSNIHKIVSFEQTGNAFFPFNKENVLVEYDPVAYITGMMTKLSPGELISFQLVISPKSISNTAKLKQMILKGEDVLSYLSQSNTPSVLIPFKLIFIVFANLTTWLLSGIFNVVSELRHGSFDQANRLNVSPDILKTKTYTSYEQQVVSAISVKVDQPLFETSLRMLVISNNKTRLRDRTSGFISSLSTFSLPGFQALKAIKGVRNIIFQPLLRFEFSKRLFSCVFNRSKTTLSACEIADLYHFPFTRVTQTEGIVKSLSRELPAPLSLKQNNDLDVVFGENTFGNESTDIGLTAKERKTHMFVIGRTGSGKTTLLYTMAKHDIEHGSGLAFIDPHGDVSDELISCIPLERMNDFVYINPYDLAYPVGINLLELTPGLDDDSAQLEKELVTEGVISLFKKIFSKDENNDSHRIEYILRNTIYTAFTVPDRTIFTIYDLLNNPTFRKQVTKELTDENLKNFWKHEFGKAGSYQVVKMAAGVTAKIGRFLFSPIAKRILEQPRSTINFDEVLNGKILICNLSQGKLGEDTAKLLGTTILTKIQQAALRRALIPQTERNQFHLYVDEFQNFATTAFTKILSEGRKYGLDVIMAEQSVSQQDDQQITDITLANVTTVVCFRTGNPKDEELMLAQFAPTVKPGDISNLPPYHFYINISAGQPQLPFSGQTIVKPKTTDTYLVSQLIQASRDLHATKYERSNKPKAVRSVPKISDSKPRSRTISKQKNDKSVSTLTA